MKCFTLIVFFILNFNIIYSQFFSDTNDRYKFEIGIEPGGFRIMKKDRITLDKNFVSVVEIRPFFGFFPLKKTNISIGIKGQYNFMKSNLISLPPVYGIGIYAKYIYPKTIKYRFLKNIRFFNELGYNRLNFTIDENTPLYEFEDFSFTFPDKSFSLNYNELNVIAGTKIYFGNGFNFEIFGKYSIFLEGKTYIKPGFSVSYTFKEKNAKQVIEENKKKIKPKEIKKEKEPNYNFFNGFIAGSSLTYIWNSNSNDYPKGENFYEEYTWNLNFATTLNKRMIAGIQVMNVFTKGTHVDDNNYLIYGLFSQFDFFAKKKTKTSMFVEMSINRGDYCTCGHLDPYRMKNLWYIGYGAGFEFPIRTISENLFFDFSFYNYNILNKYKTKYNFTQYILGLNYHFGKKRK